MAVSSVHPPPDPYYHPFAPRPAPRPSTRPRPAAKPQSARYYGGPVPSSTVPAAAAAASNRPSISISPRSPPPRLFSHLPNAGLVKPRPERKPRPIRLPGEIFSALPGEVLELILDELKTLHLGPGSESCATCWMRDLCAIALSARKWYKYARSALYEDIQLTGPDSSVHRKRFRMTIGARLVLLRRSLRARPRVAVIVRSLKVPSPPLSPAAIGMSASASTLSFSSLSSSSSSSSHSSAASESYHDLVASVVMACPNLERLQGVQPRYRHDGFQRLLYALASRRRLKQMEWILEPPGASLSTSFFLDHNASLSYLAHLTVHCQPGASLSPGALSRALFLLPALAHLHLSHVPHVAFSDADLLALPALRTLSLSRAAGVTTAGLSAFASRPKSRSQLLTLALRHQAVDSLSALARMLSSLAALDGFALVQTAPPVRAGETDGLCLMPYLASQSLRHLHWDIGSDGGGGGGGGGPADVILARSMAAGGFPQLRRLRVLRDDDGAFQAMCRPVQRIDVPSDRYAAGVLSGLTRARRAAQARLEAARQHPRYFINVQDDTGRLIDKFGLGAFLGTVESSVAYDLSPPHRGLGGAGPLPGFFGHPDVADLLLALAEDVPPLGAGCCGRWNLTEGDEKKGRSAWWHTERLRWSRLDSI